MHAAELIDDQSEELALLKGALIAMSEILTEPTLAPATPSAVSVPGMVEEVVGRLNGLIERRGITMSVSALEGAVLADRVRVIQVLTNLLCNAASHAQCCVTLTVHESEARYHFSIVDDGPGLAPDQCELVFEPFTRLRADTPGQGMGLSLCRMLARALGGEVTAAPGPGGRFELVLPAA